MAGLWMAALTSEVVTSEEATVGVAGTEVDDIRVHRTAFPTLLIVV